MKCPRCRTPELKPTMIEEDLAALGCPSCQGSLVSLLYYRHWAETREPPAAAVDPGEEETTITLETTDTTTALMCPKCSRVMMKYKLTGTVSNRLDVCSLCDEAWLDRGEWELLEALHLSHEIPSIFTEAWQRRIRHELAEGTRRLSLARLIGDGAVARVEEFAAWLKGNRHKSRILQYLYRN